MSAPDATWAGVIVEHSNSSNWYQAVVATISHYGFTRYALNSAWTGQEWRPRGGLELSDAVPLIGTPGQGPGTDIIPRRRSGSKLIEPSHYAARSELSLGGRQFNRGSLNLTHRCRSTEKRHVNGCDLATSKFEIADPAAVIGPSRRLAKRFSQ